LLRFFPVAAASSSTRADNNSGNLNPTNTLIAASLLNSLHQLCLTTLGTLCPQIRL
jgi:hypothetical protein